MSDEPQSITIKSNSRSKLTRRDILALAWKGLLGVSGVLGLGGVWRFFSYQPYPSHPTVFDLGPVEEIPPDAVINIPQAQAAILPAKDGFRALSLICPHLGCIVEVDDDGFVCPCHGSHFRYDGLVTKGPAEQALQPLNLEVDDNGHLILYTSDPI